MKLKKILLVSGYALALLLTGCNRAGKEEKTIPASEEKAEIAPKTEEPEAVPREETIPEKETVPEEENVPAEEDIGTSEALQLPVQDGIRLENTVAFVESDQEEIMEIQTEESVVDEEDPDTYAVVQKKEEVTYTNQVPEEYTDAAGNVVYQYVDGVWYYYEYSSGDVALDEADEEFALFLLNLDGSYDDYEIFRIECEEKEDDGLGTGYFYHVLYRKISELPTEPDDVEDLTVSSFREEIMTETFDVEEKVPVLIEKEIGTETYTYYGWQNLDGNAYYFDEDGNNVTGIQVIRGICYEFDSEGILKSRAGIDVSSQNGDIDWAKVKEAGIEFAMIRAGYRGCSEGMLITDSRCAEYLRGASEAGIETGVYFFSQAVTEEEALEEAGLVLDLISEYSVSMPVGLQTEYAEDIYRTRTDTLSVRERTSCVSAFCRKIADAGYTPVICGSKDWIAAGLDMSVLGGYPVWLLEHGLNATYTEPFMIRQYTVQGGLDGIEGNVNMDISYGK